jgi:hypothetical protein
MVGSKSRNDHYNNNRDVVEVVGLQACAEPMLSDQGKPEVLKPPFVSMRMSALGH